MWKEVRREFRPINFNGMSFGPDRFGISFPKPHMRKHDFLFPNLPLMIIHMYVYCFFIGTEGILFLLSITQ